MQARGRWVVGPSRLPGNGGVYFVACAARQARERPNWKCGRMIESRPGTRKQISSREWPARRPLRAVWVGPETHQHPAVPHEDFCFVKYRSEPLTDCTNFALR